MRALATAWLLIALPSARAFCDPWCNANSCTHERCATCKDIEDARMRKGCGDDVVHEPLLAHPPPPPAYPGVLWAHALQARTAAGAMLTSCLRAHARFKSDAALLLPTESRYDELRVCKNMRDDMVPAPMAIVLAADASDVQVAVKCARQAGVRTCPRSGGHGSDNDAGCSGGLLVDVRGLVSLEVDDEEKVIQFGSGFTLGGLYYELYTKHSLVFPGGTVSDVGSAGLILGCGRGMYTNVHGLACDSLLEVEYVDAWGERRYANGEHNTDMWWMARGGGGEFPGIVTKFTSRAYAAPTLYGFEYAALMLPSCRALTCRPRAALMLHPLMLPSCQPAREATDPYIPYRYTPEPAPARGVTMRATAPARALSHHTLCGPVRVCGAGARSRSPSAARRSRRGSRASLSSQRPSGSCTRTSPATRPRAYTTSPWCACVAADAPPLSHIPSDNTVAPLHYGLYSALTCVRAPCVDGRSAWTALRKTAPGPRRRCRRLPRPWAPAGTVPTLATPPSGAMTPTLGQKRHGKTSASTTPARSWSRCSPRPARTMA